MITRIKVIWYFDSSTYTFGYLFIFLFCLLYIYIQEEVRGGQRKEKWKVILKKREEKRINEQDKVNSVELNITIK